MLNSGLNDDNNTPIEGDFIETKEGFIFEVKGVEHPKDRIIAYIRYINPDQRKEKIYELDDRFLFLQAKAQGYIYNPPWLDFPIQAVPVENITKIYYSDRELSKIIQETQSKEEKRYRTPTLKKIVEFVKYLSDNSEVSLKSFGITGSHLIGREHENSDLDIVVFGRLQSKKVREFIRKCFAKGDPRIRSYSLNELKEHYKFRAKGSSIKQYQFISAEVRKLHQGFFDNIEFFIRFFEYETRESYKQKYGHPELNIIENLGRIRVKAEIRDDYSWWVTPSEIFFGNVESAEMLEKSEKFDQLHEKFNFDIRQVIGSYTLRGRYTENAKLLETAIVEGKLELIHTEKPSNNEDSNGDTKPSATKFYLRIYLGSHPEDKLFPV